MAPLQNRYAVDLIIKQAPLFSDLSQAGMAEIIRNSHVRSFPKGSVLFFQNDPAEGFYLVLSGGIMILLTTPDGRELVISEMLPGETFGELALITGRTRSTTAVSHEKSDLLVIPSTVFAHLLGNEPLFTRRLLFSLAEMLYLSNERESALAFLDAPGRLARILRMLDSLAAAVGYVTVSQEELASRTGLTRQTVAKILGRWRRLGWLLTGRGRIVILNRAALEKIERESGS